MLRRTQQSSLKMTTFKLFNPKPPTDKASWKHFKQFYLQNQIGTIMIVLLTICASCNAPTTGKTTAIAAAATTIASETNKEQVINHFLNYKASFIAAGVANNEKKKNHIDNIKVDSRSNSTTKVSLLNGLSFSSRFVEWNFPKRSLFSSEASKFYRRISTIIIISNRC